MPRLKKLRAKILKGSIRIEGNQTRIYTIENPGDGKLLVGLQLGFIILRRNNLINEKEFAKIIQEKEIKSEQYNSILRG